MWTVFIIAVTSQQHCKQLSRNYSKNISTLCLLAKFGGFFSPKSPQLGNWIPFHYPFIGQLECVCIREKWIDYGGYSLSRAFQSTNITVDDVCWNFPCLCRVKGQSLGAACWVLNLQDGHPDCSGRMVRCCLHWLHHWHSEEMTVYDWAENLLLTLLCPWWSESPEGLYFKSPCPSPPVQKSFGPPFSALIRSVSVPWLRSLSNEPQLIGQMQSPWQSGRHGYQVTRVWYLINRWEWNTGWGSDMSDT